MDAFFDMLEQFWDGVWVSKFKILLTAGHEMLAAGLVDGEAIHCHHDVQPLNEPAILVVAVDFDVAG